MVRIQFGFGKDRFSLRVRGKDKSLTRVMVMLSV
jgi:hypothetical protein